jgi:CubicO group peptidase (beta-lactamase class C family)
VVTTGSIDGRAPVAEVVEALRRWIVPARAGFPPVTVRHLLTHTAG